MVETLQETGFLPPRSPQYSMSSSNSAAASHPFPKTRVARAPGRSPPRTWSLKRSCADCPWVTIPRSHLAPSPSLALRITASPHAVRAVPAFAQQKWCAPELNSNLSVTQVSRTTPWPRNVRRCAKRKRRKRQRPRHHDIEMRSCGSVSDAVGTYYYMDGWRLLRE